MKTLMFVRKNIMTAVILLALGVASAHAAPTNPVPQTLPFTHTFGTAAFSVLPAGFGAWNGVSGAATTTQAAAEGSIPTGDAVLKTTSSVPQSTGGIYAYAPSGNALIYLQGSSNATNGVTQLMCAVSTRGATSIKVNYSITMLNATANTASVVLQCRTGVSGPWMSVPNSVYTGNGTTRITGQVNTYTDLPLPAVFDNKDTVQLRWAFWRGTESGTVSGIGIDDIAIYAGSGSAAPVAPSLLSLVDKAVNQPLTVSLSWNAVSSATRYRLQLATDASFTQMALDTAEVPGLSMNVTGLSINSIYYWRVSASNAIGTSDYSPSRSFSTMWTIPPAAPVQISPASGASGYPLTPTIVWGNTPGAMTYRFQLATDSLFSAVVLDDSPIASERYTPKGLAGNSTYWWRVNATNTAGTSVYSPSWKFTTRRPYAVPQLNLFAGSLGAALADSVAGAFTARTVLDYAGAREKIYGEIDKVGDTLKCVYTGYAIYMPPGSPAIASATAGSMNAEHTFPQSMGAETGNANSDMHHLYATNNTVNSARSNWPYAEVPEANVTTWYRLGSSRSTKPPADAEEYSKFGTTTFEPRDAHKGHVARAIFYFYTIYKAQSTASFFEGMKQTLLKWHSLFPVDSSEHARTLKIAAYQSGKANPFILDTTLVRRVYAPSVTGVPTPPARVPGQFVLEQNYPNPFNPSTTIRFTVPRDGRVTLKVYDMLGRVVSTVLDEAKTRGSYSVSWNAAFAASGMYFYRIEAGGSSVTRKLVVQK